MTTDGNGHRPNARYGDQEVFRSPGGETAARWKGFATR